MNLVESIKMLAIINGHVVHERNYGIKCPNCGFIFWQQFPLKPEEITYWCRLPCINFRTTGVIRQDQYIWTSQDLEPFGYMAINFQGVWTIIKKINND